MRDSKGRFIKGHRVPVNWSIASAIKNTGSSNKFKTKYIAYICDFCCGCFMVNIDKVKCNLDRDMNIFCGRDCYYKYRAENYHSENHPMFGKNHTEETKGKIKQNIPLRVGKDAPNWRGGVTTENNLLRWCQDNKDLRKRVFERDDYTCQICGDRNGNGKTILLNAHHIKSWAEYPELRFEDSNCITFCVPCHKKIHKGEISFNNTHSWVYLDGDVIKMEGFE